MDFHRAEEILQSRDVYEVLYKNDSIWINSLNSQNQTAEVTLNGSSAKKIVPVTELFEVNKQTDYM
ncbi:MAG: H-type small acid-soluble spore protein [Bacillota bacterium]